MGTVRPRNDGSIPDPAWKGNPPEEWEDKDEEESEDQDDYGPEPDDYVPCNCPDCQD